MKLLRLLQSLFNRRRPASRLWAGNSIHTR